MSKLSRRKDDRVYGDLLLSTCHFFLESTLEWESFEQQCVWHLIQAEDVLLESFVNILPTLKQDQHAEALSNLLILMKSVS